MKVNKVLAAILAGTILLMSTSCSGGGSQTSTANASKSETSKAEDKATTKKSEIRFTWWGDTKRHDVYNAICDEFEKANPNIKVVREANSWADYWDKLATQVGGGNAPDVMGMHPQFAADYAARGALADLQPFMDDGTIETDKIPLPVLDGGKVGDLMCMVSQGVTFTNLIGNKTMADEIGVTIPTSTEDWKWSDFSEKSKDFKSKADTAGKTDWFFSNDINAYNSFRYMVRQHGKDLYTDEGDLGFDTDVTEKWFDFWKDLRDANAIPDAAATTEDGAVALEQKIFSLGKCVVSSAPANQLWLYQAQLPDSELVLMRMPTGENGEHGEYIEGAHNSVSAKSDTATQKASAQFINFFTNNAQAQKLLKMEQGVPANTDMAEVIKPLLEGANQKALDFVNNTMPVATIGTYAPKGASEVDSAFKDSTAKVAYGELSPADGATEFVKTAKEICAKNKK